MPDFIKADVSALQEQIPDYKIVSVASHKPGMLSHHIATKIVYYVGKISDPNVVIVESIYTISGNKGYIVDLVSNGKTDMDIAVPIMNHIISSFQIIQGQQPEITNSGQTLPSEQQPIISGVIPVHPQEEQQQQSNTGLESSPPEQSSAPQIPSTPINETSSTSTIGQLVRLSNTSASSPVTAGWHSYANSTYGISLLYPPNWMLGPVGQPNGTNNAFFYIMEFEPPISQDPAADTILGVAIDNYTREVTPSLDQYIYDSINSYRYQVANVSDFKVIKAGTNITIGGHPGIFYIIQRNCHLTHLLEHTLKLEP